MIDVIWYIQFLPNCSVSTRTNMAEKVILTVSLSGAKIKGVKLIVKRSNVRVKTNASRFAPKCSGPPAAVKIATDVQFIAVSAVVKTAVHTIVYFRRFVQLNGF